MKNAKLAFFNFFSFISIGTITSQIILMINDLGVEPYQKNLILGLSALVAFIAAVLIGRKSDREGKIRSSFFISMSLYLIGVVLAYITEQIWIRALAVLFMFGIMRSVMSCTETLVYVESKENFGKYHCFGALGSIAGSLIGGMISDSMRTILCVASGLAAMYFMAKIEEKPRETQKVTWPQIKSLLTNKEYIGFVTILFFLMLIGFADQFVVVDKMIELGADKGLVSMKYALQAFMEIPVYLLVNRLFKRFEPFSLLLFCILMSCVKFILYGFAHTTWLILLVSMMQIVTHPLIVVLSKKLINAVTDEKLTATSQIVGFAFYFGMSGFLTPLISQMLMKWLSMDAVIYIFAFFAVFPLLIWLYMKKYGKVKSGDSNEKLSG